MLQDPTRLSDLVSRPKLIATTGVKTARRELICILTPMAKAMRRVRVSDE